MKRASRVWVGLWVAAWAIVGVACKADRPEAIGETPPTGAVASQGAAADTTPPDTSIVAGPEGTLQVNSGTFQFAASEANVTFRCQLDAQPEEVCTSPKSYSGLVNGDHVFKVAAVDAAGNAVHETGPREWRARIGRIPVTIA